MTALRDVPAQVFLLKEAAARGFGWDTRTQSPVLTPEVPGRDAIRLEGTFLIPSMRTQEVVIELERAAVLQRLYNKRGATVLVNYNVLGDDGDARDLKVKVLLRDDRPIRAGFFTPES